MGFFSAIGNFFRNAANVIKTGFNAVATAVSGAITTVASAVAAIAPHPVVKAVATAVAIAVPVITVGVTAVKGIMAKKKAKPETSVEKMISVDVFDDDEHYHDEDVAEFRQNEADKIIFGKKEAKRRKRDRLSKKATSLVNDLKAMKASSKKAFECFETEDGFDSVTDAMSLDEVIAMDVDDDDEEVYIDEAPTGQIYRSKRTASC